MLFMAALMRGGGRSSRYSGKRRRRDGVGSGLILAGRSNSDSWQAHELRYRTAQHLFAVLPSRVTPQTLRSIEIANPTCYLVPVRLKPLEIY